MKLLDRTNAHNPKSFDHIVCLHLVSSRSISFRLIYDDTEFRGICKDISGKRSPDPSVPPFFSAGQRRMRQTAFLCDFFEKKAFWGVTKTRGGWYDKYVKYGDPVKNKEDAHGSSK
ncbi:MAG: hypothetical protein II412_03100, partial [Clostridia bacterium]|nr:hypothetical protein [Clostridia bacterium]